MKLKEWLKDAERDLTEGELNFVLKDIFGKDKLTLVRENPAIDGKVSSLRRIKDLYCQNEMPLAYVLGKEEFFGLVFSVDQSVLIPRPETEIIVERALELITQEGLTSVLDLGCGSGNIAISITKNASYDVSVFASDISVAVLKVCAKNAAFHKSPIGMVSADLFSAFKEVCFDMIITNPPYVEAAYLKDNRALSYEPRRALFGGDDGLCLIRLIVAESYKYVKRGGYLLMEIGHGQRAIVEDIIHESGCYEIEEWIKDYSGTWRGVILKNG